MQLDAAQQALIATLFCTASYLGLQDWSHSLNRVGIQRSR